VFDSCFVLIIISLKFSCQSDCDAENIFQVSSYPGNFFRFLFLVFFQWRGDVVEDGGELIVSKLIEWKKQKKKPISQVLQLQLHFSCFCFAFFGFLVFLIFFLACFGNGSDFFFIFAFDIRAY